MSILRRLTTYYKTKNEAKQTQRKEENRVINNAVIDLFELGVLKPVTAERSLVIVDTQMNTGELNPFQNSVKLFALAGLRQEYAYRVRRNLLYYRWKLIEGIEENPEAIDKVTGPIQRLSSLPKDISEALPFILLSETDGTTDAGNPPYTINTDQKSQNRKKVELLGNH